MSTYSATDPDADFTIQHIDQLGPIIIEGHTRFQGYPIIGFDWDNCISLKDGYNVPLRDPITTDNYPNGDGQRTENFFYALNQNNIPWFVITARLQGLSKENLIKTLKKERKISSYTDANTVQLKLEEYLIKSVENMYSALPPLSHEMLPTLNVATPRMFDYKTEDGTDYTSVNVGNVVYAGGGSDQTSNKGLVFTELLRFNILPAQHVQYAIFVDNDIRHIRSVSEAFKKAGQRDKLITVYYPQTPLLHS